MMVFNTDSTEVFCYCILPIAKLDRSSTATLQSFPRELSQSQNGLTIGAYNKSFKNGYHHSANAQSPSYTHGNDLNNGHSQSASVISAQSKANSSGRWIASQFLHDIRDRNELIFRRVRGILNKITPEKFDKLSYNLVNIGIDSKTVLKGIIILIFEKAIDEQKYCSLYASLCHRLSQNVPNFDDPSSNTTTFLRLLLNKCQEEFETRSKASSAFDKNDGVLSALDQEARYIAKRKMLGNLKFIGELGKLGLLQEAILHKCIQQLLAKKKRVPLSGMAEDIECMCQIVTTIGRRLDTPKAKNIMDQYFDRIQALCQSEELPTRIRFLLQDVLDLRKNKWIQRRLQRENGPRSVTQMRWELMGPMMPPPFPYRSSDSQADLDAGFSLYNGSNGMSWLNDSVLYSNGLFPPSTNDTHMDEYVDDSRDIFGKPVQQAVISKKASKTIKSQPIVDPFEPHYLKSKSAVKTSPKSNMKRSGVNDEKISNIKPKNKGNPWNIDPFAPHYSKPSIFPVNEDKVKSNESVISPRVEMRNLPQNSRLNGSSQYNKPIKKDQDISLRPASMLIKKEEKTKGFGIMEELPPKMQQFTNLTINDKTNTKSKKSGLSKVDVEKKVNEILEKFSDDQLLENVLNEIQSMATNLKYSKMVAKQLFMSSICCERKRWSQLARICIECGRQLIVSSDTIVDALLGVIDDSKIMSENSATAFVAHISAEFIYNSISFEYDRRFMRLCYVTATTCCFTSNLSDPTEELITISSFVEHFQDGKHYPTVLVCFQHLLQNYGQNWLETAHLKANVDLKLTFPKDCRSDHNILQVVRGKKLDFLFPHLCLKENLLKLMQDGTSEDEMLKWVKTQVENKIEKKLLIHMLVTCAITMATIETLDHSDPAQKPEKEFQEKEKDTLDKAKVLLQEYLLNEPTFQLEAIYALQIFCYEKAFPKDMLLRLFILFYNMEIIEEDVFLKWKEDINDVYPGKGKSLFQVNNWLQWLETADEEDGINDDEEGFEEEL